MRRRRKNGEGSRRDGEVTSGVEVEEGEKGGRKEGKERGRRKEKEGKDVSENIQSTKVE